MTTQASQSMPRGFFALSTGVGTLAGMAIAAVLAGQMDAGGMVQAALAAVVLAMGAMCIVAMLGPPLVTADRFGMVVLGTSAVRVVLVLGAIIMLTEAAGLPKRPVVFGLLGGVLPIMITEAFAAVVLIYRRDQSTVHTGSATRAMSGRNG